MCPPRHANEVKRQLNRVALGHCSASSSSAPSSKPEPTPEKSMAEILQARGFKVLPPYRMSTHGTKRTFAAPQQFVRFWTTADIEHLLLTNAASFTGCGVFRLRNLQPRP